MLRKSLLVLLSSLSIVSMPTAFAREGDFIVISTSDYVDSIGFYHIIGEIENDSGRLQQLVEITATLYDTQNNVVGRPIGYAFIDVMRQGEKSAFHLIFTDSAQVAKIASYKISISPTIVLADKPRNLELKVGDGYLDAIGFYHLVGEITNNGDKTASFVEVSVAFYDKDNKIVDTAVGYTNPSDIAPGATEAFEILSVSPSGHAIVKASVNSDSTQYATTPEFPMFTIVAAGAIGGAVILGRLKSRKCQSYD